MSNISIFDTAGYRLFCEAMRAEIETDLGCVLTEEVLTEGKFIDRLRWASCRASLKFLDEDTLNTIILARYSDGEERIKAPRKQKVRMVRDIADELPENTKWKIIHGHAAEYIDMKANKAHVASAAGLGTVAVAGAAMAAMGICSITAAPILGAIGIGGLICHGTAAAIARARNKKANTLRRDQIAAILTNELDLNQKYTHNQDGTITFGGMMRKLKESYIYKPTDELLYFDNGFALLEDAPMSIRRVSAEEYVIKNIRHKILMEATQQYDPVAVLELMGSRALRPYNGMPFNKFIIANLIPGEDMDAIMGEAGDYGILINACLGDDAIQHTFKEIKKELKAETPNSNAMEKLRGDLEARILTLAQRLAPQSEQIAESVEMMHESFLGAAAVVGVGTLAAIGISKAIGALARWIKNRKKDKNYIKEQKVAAAKGDNYVTFSGNGSPELTITIGDDNSSSPYRRDPDDPDLPKYRNGKKVGLEDFLKQLDRLYQIIDSTGEGILLDKGMDDKVAITLYSPDEIRHTFFEYEFDKGINRYYQIGEDDIGDIICFCPQAADTLYIVDIEDMVAIHDVKGLKRFKLCGGGMSQGYAIGTIRELKFKKATMFDPAVDKDVEVKIS